MKPLAQTYSQPFLHQLRFAIMLSLCVLLGCSDAGSLLNLALNPPKRKPIDPSIVGVNNFFVDEEFGTLPQQYSDIKNTLRLKYIRVLFPWTTEVQPSPGTKPFYGFFDDIIASAPEGVDILIVLAHTPNWMVNSANWKQNNPRLTWVNDWLKPTVAHYKDNPKVVGFQIWNEPDSPSLPSDIALGLTEPQNYAELLNYSSRAIRSLAPGKLVVTAATESIQQNFPNNLRYNKALKDLGAEGLADVWAIHYYGKQFESVITNNGVADFLNSIRIPIWITESGENGPNNQLAYVETAWPFLKEKIPGIARIYYYQYGETTPPAQNFGLRTTDPLTPVSDLYIFLRDRP